LPYVFTYLKWSVEPMMKQHAKLNRYSQYYSWACGAYCDSRIQKDHD
jgi:hypothetical protein